MSKKCKNKKCCNTMPDVYLDASTGKIVTPFTKRNKVERFLDRYNHILELIRTILGCATVVRQLIILYRLSN